MANSEADGNRAGPASNAQEHQLVESAPWQNIQALTFRRRTENESRKPNRACQGLCDPRRFHPKKSNIFPIVLRNSARGDIQELYLQGGAA
jgi:hypothetical protein